MKITVLLFLAAVLSACSTEVPGQAELDVFINYFEASKSKSESKWQYTSDTIKVWFDSRDGKPGLRIKGAPPSGKWTEWDKEMHSTSYYDSIWYNRSEHTVQGYFYENNDFYELIGKGPTKTLRTYWLNSANKITEILIYWIPEENTTTSEHLEPIVAWASAYDSAEIAGLYPEGRIVPSKENAIRWKELLEQYNNINN